MIRPSSRAGVQAPRLRAQVEDAEVARVVDEERRARQLLGRLDDLRPAVRPDPPLAQVVAVQLRLRRDEALRQLGLGHLEREQGDRLAGSTAAFSAMLMTSSLSHRWPRGQNDQVAGLEAAGDLVEVGEAARRAGERHALARHLLQLVELVVENVLDRAQLARAVVVGDLEERATPPARAAPSAGRGR